VLTVNKVLASGATGAADYFAGVSATGDYFVSKDGDPFVSPGTWISTAEVARFLDLTAAVTVEGLLSILDGRDPRTGKSIVRRWGGRERVAAHDLTFSAPSSVSTLWAIADAEEQQRIQHDQDAAVAAALSASTFDLRTLRIAAFEASAGLLDAGQVEELVRALRADERVVACSEDRWTTKEIIALERDIMVWRDVRALLPTPPPPPERLVVEARLRAPHTLSEEQEQALTAMLEQRTTTIQGHAGVGKGVVLHVAANVWHHEGRRVFALALGGRQAQNLATDLGDHAEAMTLDQFEARLQSGRIQLTDTDVVAVDETGQIDTRRLARLTTAIGLGPKVVMLGDHAQLSPIGPGSLWPLLSKGGPQLVQVWRTKLDWERKAWGHLRRGEGETALGLYARHGRLTLLNTRADALAQAIADWERAGRSGLIITDASNAERHRVNRQAQACRMEAEELGVAGVSATARDGEATFHVHDRVVFRGRYESGVTGSRVENGTTGHVVAIDVDRRTVSVHTDERQSRVVTVLLDYTNVLDLHYAAHVYASQGTTVDRTFVVAGGWQTDREHLYVACSRSRFGTSIYLDRESLGEEVDADALAEAAARASRSRAKRAALSHGVQERRKRARATRPLLVEQWKARERHRDEMLWHARDRNRSPFPAPRRRRPQLVTLQPDGTR
jgi:hypothetical protein